jgi:uncharacterized protein YaaR (DUF327 family)
MSELPETAVIIDATKEKMLKQDKERDFVSSPTDQEDEEYESDVKNAFERLAKEGNFVENTKMKFRETYIVQK